MAKQPRAAFEALRASVAKLPDFEREAALELLVEISQWIDNDWGNPELSKGIDRVRAAVKRAAKVTTGSESKLETAEALRYLMKARGNALATIPKPLVRKVQAYFWKLLAENAELWGERELSNLLSYSMRHRIRLDLGKTPAKTLAQMYGQYFKALPLDERDFIFKDLIKSFGSEPYFRSAVMRGGKI